MQSALARTLALSGKRDRAIDALRTLGEAASTRYVSPVEFMTLSFAAGDNEAGYRWLTKAGEDRSFDLLALKVDPRFDGLRDDRRYGAVAGRIGLG
jgi:hypothetical protein